MRTLSLSLDVLRATLLAACGASVGACTAIPSEPPDDEGGSKDKTQTKTREEPELAPKPKRDPSASDAACANPTAVFANGRDTGYVTCADGALNRASALACANPVIAPACGGNEARRSCEKDADCTDKAHGFCQSGSGQIGTYCSCIYPCMDDAECGADEACMCPDATANGPVVSMCAPAQCKTGADCVSGECGATVHFTGCNFALSLRCREGGDVCRADADCGEGGGACAALDRGEGVATAAYACAQQSCVIGRPLTVAQGSRVATVVAAAWGDRTVEGLPRSEERADYWLGIARMEHASVASFARFVSELMGFGAPPELLADALVAAADEVRHAEETFALASAYAGRPLGPGTLRVDDLTPTSDLGVFVTRLVTEGCVGETLGVAEANALLDEEDLHPALRSRLERIALDETRHAALAWRTLRWLSGRVEASVVERAFARAIADVSRVEPERADPVHGRLGTEARRRARVCALANVVTPCLRELGFAAAA